MKIETSVWLEHAARCGAMLAVADALLPRPSTPQLTVQLKQLHQMLWQKITMVAELCIYCLYVSAPTFNIPQYAHRFPLRDNTT